MSSYFIAFQYECANKELNEYITAFILAYPFQTKKKNEEEKKCRQKQTRMNFYHKPNKYGQNQPAAERKPLAQKAKTVI